MKLPKPEPGLVIRYSYLWQREHLAGREDGMKDRPCAIVLAVKDGGDARVLVVPITHNRPGVGISAMELPAAVKKATGPGRRALLDCLFGKQFLPLAGARSPPCQQSTRRADDLWFPAAQNLH